MNTETIIRAWKDRRFRSSLGDAETLPVPEHPSGISYLTDQELALAAGSWCSCSPSAICCMGDSMSTPSECMSDCAACAPAY